MESLSGTRLGEYEVLGLLGRGGMGEVYEGLQPMIGKRVAIKVLLPKAADKHEVNQRFIAEARAVNAIGHRGVVDIFSFGTLDDGRLYYVMDLLPGEPLHVTLHRQGALPPLEAVELLDEMLDALSAAHLAGIVHRDLKPSNLYLVTQPDGSRYLKLLDFGIAKLLDYGAAKELGERPLTLPNTVLGTPGYMAPEQLAGIVSPAIDLYAVGCIAFELLLGVPPYDGDDMDVLQKHLKAPVPELRGERPEISPALEEWVQRMMAKAPGDRPPSALAARAELRRVREDLHEVARDRVRTTMAKNPFEVRENQTTEESVAAAPPTTRLMVAKTTPMRPAPEAATPYDSAIRPTPWRFVVLAALVAAVVTALAYAALGGRPEPAAAAPPVIERAAPVEVPGPAPAAAVALPAPTAAELSSRIAGLRAGLKGGANRKTATLLLDDATEQLAGARTDDERRAVAGFLDDFERQYGPK